MHFDHHNSILKNSSLLYSKIFPLWIESKSYPVSVMEKKIPSLMIERPKVPRETWDALRAHIMRQRKKNKLEKSEEYKNSMTEKTEKVIPLEFMMRSRNISGFQTIVGQILGHVDFDTLVSCRLVSKEFKNFLDHKKIWIARLDQVCKKFLNRLLMENNYLKTKCKGFQVMLPEDIKNMYNSWITFLEIIKTKGSIKDLINFTKTLGKLPILKTHCLDLDLNGKRPFVTSDSNFASYLILIPPFPVIFYGPKWRAAVTGQGWISQLVDFW